MDNQVYIIEGQAYTILQAIPESKEGDNVTITIYNVTDSTADTAATAMTFVTGETWKYAFTPSDGDIYLATITHVAFNAKYYKYLNSVSSTPSPSTAGSTGSTLTVLQKKLLLSVDNYNAGDLSGDGSAGDQATRALNQALQKIYSMIKDSRYVQAYPDTTSLASVAGTDYIALSGITDLDAIIAITDPTNQYKLTQIPFWKYRMWSPDPSQSTGTPTHYARIFDRIYLYPRPDAAVDYTVDYQRTYADLSSGSDQAAIPAKYDYWIIAEAALHWQRMKDPADLATMQTYKLMVDEAREAAEKDIYGDFDQEKVAESHWDHYEATHLRFDSPVGS